MPNRDFILILYHGNHRLNLLSINGNHRLNLLSIHGNHRLNLLLVQFQLFIQRKLHLMS